MKVVVFGPGKIGCGFAGMLLHLSGHEVVFVGRNRETIDHLNRIGRYKVLLTGQGQNSEFLIDRIRAVPVTEAEKVADEIASSGLVITSVGCGNLGAVAPVIAEGLRRKETSINVFGFENFAVQAALAANIGPECGCLGCSFKGHSFSPVLISRIMSERIGDPTRDEPLLFIGDHSSDFIIDEKRTVQPVPEIKGMRVVSNYEAWAQKKLFTFSAGHATTAYLGYLKGYHYIHTAIRDPEIQEAVMAVMKEGQEGLLAVYGPEVAGDERELREIVLRFENAALNDSIERVGRDPARKLGARERLIGSARLAEKAGIRPEKLMLAVAAALYYCDRTDPKCENIGEGILSGPGKILREISGLDPATDIAGSAIRLFARIIGGESYKEHEGPLLSLRRFFWA